MSCGFGGTVDKKMERAIEDELFKQFGDSVEVVYMKSEFTDVGTFSRAEYHASCSSKLQHIKVKNFEVFTSLSYFLDN